MIAMCRSDYDPPFCCQPPLTPEQRQRRTERVATAVRAAEASRPHHCPTCGSDDICFMFDPDMLLWQCSACSDVFVERD